MPTPTLLIGGLNCSAQLFEHQIPMLWRYAPVVIADHRSASSIEELATEILRDAPPVFSLAGLSLGGFIAFEILRRCPERVERLALLGTSARPETEQEKAIRLPRMELATAGRFLELPPLHFAKNVAPSRQTDDELRAKHRGMTQDVGPHGYLRQQTAIGGRPDSRPGLGAIQCPTTIIVGDSDFITPPAHSQEMADAIPNSRLVVIEGCGHLSTLERPQAVNAALQTWREQGISPR